MFQKLESDSSLRELYYVLYLIRSCLLNSDELRNLDKKRIYDVMDFSYIPIVGEYVDYSFGFVSKNKDTLINSFLDLLSKRQITKK